jgi:hypothetical protein
MGTDIAVREQTISIDSQAYREIAKAIKPHLDRSGLRPLLSHTRVRFDGAKAAFEATDAYSFIRATLPIGDRTDLTPEPFDLFVPGEHLWSLRPKSQENVELTVIDGDTATVACGVVTVRLSILADGSQKFPDMDKIAAEYIAPNKRAAVDEGIWFNPALLARCSALPSHSQGIGLRFISPLRPVHVTANGVARYDVLIMPIRATGKVATHHELWLPVTPTREKAA